MKDAASPFARGDAPSKIVVALDGATVQPELMAVADALVELQQARHEADYDVLRRFTRQEVLDLVEGAEKAFMDWNLVRFTIQADAFLVALLALDRMRS